MFFELYSWFYTVRWFLPLTIVQAWQVRSTLTSSLPRTRILIICTTIIEVILAVLMMSVPTDMTGLTNCGKVTAYHEKLVIQRVNGRPSLPLSFSFSGFSSSNAMPVHLFELSSYLFDNAISSLATSNVYTNTVLLWRLHRLYRLSCNYLQNLFQVLGSWAGRGSILVCLQMFLVTGCGLVFSFF